MFDGFIIPFLRMKELALDLWYNTSIFVNPAEMVARTHSGSYRAADLPL